MTGVYNVLLTFQSIYRCSDERSENGDGEGESMWRLPGLLYADDLVLYGKSKEELRAMMGHFVGV